MSKRRVKMQTVGYKVGASLGYEVFINGRGTISVKQECPAAGTQVVCLSKDEAESLARALDEMQDWCDTKSQPIVENPDTDEEKK